jgi:hypothetical protein
MNDACLRFLSSGSIEVQANKKEQGARDGK